jgi:hypothetical protein
MFLSFACTGCEQDQSAARPGAAALPDKDFWPRPRDKASRGLAREEEAMFRERFEDTARTRVPPCDASQSGGVVC